MRGSASARSSFRKLTRGAISGLLARRPACMVTRSHLVCFARNRNPFKETLSYTEISHGPHCNLPAQRAQESEGAASTRSQPELFARMGEYTSTSLDGCRSKTRWRRLELAKMGECVRMQRLGTPGRCHRMGSRHLEGAVRRATRRLAPPPTCGRPTLSLGAVG